MGRVSSSSDAMLGRRLAGGGHDAAESDAVASGEPAAWLRRRARLER
jgi:hypothetical protein